MSRPNQKPVTIITGFLGAGKTTFLNSLIDFKKGSRLVIIENEFGEEGIDGDLIVGTNKEIFELNNGCLCCSLNDDFYELLEDLWEKRDEYDEIVIETTGIADPAAVSSPFLTNKSVSYFYQLKRVICLVDARHIEYQLADTEEARKQISFSDILLITKIDLVSPDKLEKITNLLEEINPFATVMFGCKANYPLEEIQHLDRLQMVQKKPKYSLMAEPVRKHLHHDLVSLSLSFLLPFNLPVLRHRLTVFLLFQARQIYRVKGIIAADGQARKIIIQSVNKDLIVGYGDEWKSGEEKQSRIVFIGKNLKPLGFEKMLKQCLLSTDNQIDI